MKAKNISTKFQQLYKQIFQSLYNNICNCDEQRYSEHYFTIRSLEVSWLQVLLRQTSHPGYKSRRLMVGNFTEWAGNITLETVFWKLTGLYGKETEDFLSQESELKELHFFLIFTIIVIHFLHTWDNISCRMNGVLQIF